MTQDNPQEQVTVTDKRRIDPETGEVREAASEKSAPESVSSGLAPGVASLVTGDSETGGKIVELTADLQRVQADFANYRKRALRDQQVATDRAKAAVVTELLGVLDDLDRARSHGDLESGPLKSVADKLTGALTGLGLAAFGAEGEAFDPLLHEAVQHEGDGTHSVIGSVLRCGYKLGEQVLRHAMVGVVDTVPDEETGDATDAAAEGTESEASTD